MRERKTFFLDIDGTILEYIVNFVDIFKHPVLKPLPDVVEKTTRWHCQGHCIVLVTARPEGLRRLTEEQLHSAGIPYDTLLMGIGSGPRVLVNDYINEEYKAKAYNVLRNVDGLKNVEE